LRQKYSLKSSPNSQETQIFTLHIDKVATYRQFKELLTFEELLSKRTVFDARRSSRDISM